MSRKPSEELTAHDLVVLSVLTEQPMHGYKLNQTLRERDVQDWAAMSKPQVYYSLKKLLTRKLIKSVDSTSQKTGITGPEGDVFAVTPSGLSALRKGLREAKWATQRPPPPFLTWLAICPHLDKSERKEVIAVRKEFLEQELLREKKTLKDFDNADDPMAQPGKLMVELTVKQFELELAWLDQVTRVLG